MFFLGFVLGAEPKSGPREASTGVGRGGIGAGNLFGRVFIIVVGWLVAVIRASGIIVATAGSVREGVIGVVDFLELLGTGRAFGGVRGYTVGMGF